MSEFNPAKVKAEMPGRIEDIQQAHLVKLGAAADFYQEVAKTTGAKDFINAAAKLREVVDSDQDWAKRFIGQEGDTAQDNGSLNAAISVAVKLENAVGGVE